MIVKAPRLTCARCETRLADPSTRIFSRSTKLHFCGDVDSCSKRVAKKMSAKQRVPMPKTPGAGVTTGQLAEMAALEACERVSRAVVDIYDTCDDECPLSPRQKMLVGTALLREFMCLNVDLARMFANATMLESWTREAASWRSPEDLTPIGDEVEAWLAEHDGGEFLQ